MKLTLRKDKNEVSGIINREKIDLSEVLYAFLGETTAKYEPHGNGHINSTFLVSADKRYILQKINTEIFREPERLMDNIVRTSEHICRKGVAAGRDASRCALTVVRTRDNSTVFWDSQGGCWRLYEFVEGTVFKQKVESPDDFYACAKAFGEFQGMLADFPAGDLCEPIADFHNTPNRYANLMAAVSADKCDRLKDVKAEVEFAVAREEFCKTLENAYADGSLPLRVTHNDTKLNNILFDEVTGEPVCVVDLDTVMPGYSVNDFGDAIRFGANTAAEDEADLSLVSLDLDLFEVYAKGFVEGCGGRLTRAEIELLPIGAIMMTLECGMRFLTDHLEGDTYFKIHRGGHNLDRARNQFALVADMERKLDQMNSIISELL